jgi:hypothetical protein
MEEILEEVDKALPSSQLTRGVIGKVNDVLIFGTEKIGRVWKKTMEKVNKLFGGTEE